MKKLLYLIFLLPVLTFGQQLTINIGVTANDGTGDNLRAAFTKVNTNFTELYTNVVGSGTATGTDTYLLSADPTAASYYTGQKFSVIFTNANTGAATININNLGPKALKKNVSSDLESGDIDAGSAHVILYDGTNFQVLTLGGGAAVVTPGGSDGYAQYNNGGVFGGIAGFTVDDVNNVVKIHKLSGDATDGLIVEASGGTDVGILGAGNTANATWYGSHNYDGATANTIASFGASKTLSSLSTATYPSLTELSYVKGVTSAIQTQLNAKGTVSSVALSTGTTGTDVNVSGSPVTGSGTITLNIPTASASNRGVLSSSDWTAFNANSVTSANSSTSGNITLDLNSKAQSCLNGSATFSTPKTIALSNTTNAITFVFTFEVTNIAATLTVPSDWYFNSPDYNTSVWTPPATGKYFLSGKYDSVLAVWFINVNGPYTH